MSSGRGGISDVARLNGAGPSRVGLRLEPYTASLGWSSWAGGRCRASIAAFLVPRVSPGTERRAVTSMRGGNRRLPKTQTPLILADAKRKKPQKETGWNVLRIRGSGTVSLGLVDAVDETDAFKKAVERFAIRPELQGRIIVRPWD
jgi:hypothetical protein